jgi:hypothetical protein
MRLSEAILEKERRLSFFGKIQKLYKFLCKILNENMRKEKRMMQGNDRKEAK